MHESDHWWAKVSPAHAERQTERGWERLSGAQHRFPLKNANLHGTQVSDPEPESDTSVTMIPMRRAVAILLTVVFSLLLTAPIYASSDRSLPACCRRDGKHRCGARKLISRTSPAFAAPQQTCPYFPRSTAAQHRVDIYFKTTFISYSPHADRPAVRLLSRSSQCASSTRSHQKRGPPELST